MPGVAALALLLAATASPAAEEAAPEPLPAPLQAPAPAALDVSEATVADLQAAMASGRFTARALAEAYLSRIAAIDPKLRSVVEVNPDALAIADALDAERREKGARGPLLWLSSKKTNSVSLCAQISLQRSPSSS